jgi:two-component system alkaline phosphatase synthesis response regulator PhoP
MRILVADDDPSILEPLVLALEQHGYDVVSAPDGEKAWESFRLQRPDFAVLDVSMPNLDGLTLTRRIAASGEPRVPVILLTGRRDLEDKVRALDLGADDYVVKPCSDRELLARIRAVWRRSSGPTRILRVGELAIDPQTHDFFLKGERVEVTALEFKLLLELMEHAGQVVRYNTLMLKTWGYAVSNDLLRVTIFRIRQKIEPDPRKPLYLHTIPRVGLIIQEKPAPAEEETEEQTA